MTDKELLLLAAKAAGHEDGRYVENEPIQGASRTGIWSDIFEELWNPLTDDGDALRLAAKLRMKVLVDDFDGSYVQAVADNFDEEIFLDSSVVYCIENVDIYAATRRAIVLAAANLEKERQRCKK